MFYYIDQPCFQSFPAGLVKTKSHFIVRSVETDTGRQKLVVPMISVNVYPFLAFSDLILKIKKMVFSGYTMPPDSKETELGSSKQETFPSADKNTRVVLVPCFPWRWVSTSLQLILVMHSVHQVINPASKTPSPFFLPSPPSLNLQTVQELLFR